MDEIRFCKKHGDTNFFQDNCGTWRCRKCRNEAVQKRREKVKLMAIEYKGGKCEICGYDKCPDALEFHHLNSNEKDFGIAQKGYTRSFELVKKELDKCILVCSNCHREIHYNLRDKQTDKYKEELLKEKVCKLNECKTKKKELQIEKKCDVVENIKVKKNNIPTKDELISLLEKAKNFSKAGRLKCVSDNAVRKWCKKYDIPTSKSQMLIYLKNIGRLP